MKNVDLSIVVISYNTCDITLECLRSVFLETTDLNFELIVLDNASEDGTVSAIEAEFGKKIKLIVSRDNLGFAAGNNLASQYASGEYLLLLNPDTVVLNRAIGKLFTFAQNNSDGKIWGGRTVFKDLSLNPASCWSKQSIWSLVSQVLGLNSIFRKSNLFNPEGLGGWNRSGVRRVDIVSGCFLLIKKDLWDALNGFHNIFFMYGEEADLCLRARDVGAMPMVTSEATIIHYGGASEKVKSDKMIRLLKAKGLLIKLHFPSSVKFIGLWLLFLWPVSRYIAHSTLKFLGRSKSMESAKTWKEILSRRKEWTVFYKLDDAKVIKS